jgi:hypothetical protein
MSLTQNIRLTQTISVTASHIAIGKPGSCRSCPITHAIYAVNPQALEVAVWPDAAEMTRAAGEPVLEAGLPQEARDFIAALDTPGLWTGPSPVKPFSFEVTWLSPAEMAKELAS